MKADALLALLDRARLDPNEALQRLLAPCLPPETPTGAAVRAPKQPEALLAA